MHCYDYDAYLCLHILNVRFRGIIISHLKIRVGGSSLEAFSNHSADAEFPKIALIEILQVSKRGLL